MEKVLNPVLMFLILSALVVQIAQSAGFIFQPERSDAIQVTGAVAVTRMPTVGIYSAHGPIEVEIEAFDRKLGELNVNLESVGGSSILFGSVPVNLDGIGGQDVGVTASGRFGLIQNGVLTGFPVNWGEFSISR